MLILVRLQNSQEKKTLLDSFNHEDSTWLISNLRSKIELQNFFLKKDGFFIEDSALRASDLWRTLFLRERPHFRLLENEILLIEAKNWIEKNFSSELLRQKSAGTLLQVAHQIHEIYFQEASLSLLHEWIEVQEKQPRWWFWFRLAIQWLQFLEEKKILSSAWIPAYVVGRSLNVSWPKNLIVDLGVQLKTSEAEILKSWGQDQDIQILYPLLEDSLRLKNNLNKYELLGLDLPLSKKTSPILRTKAIREFYSFNSALAECQFAAHQVRQWIERDQVPLENILIVIPELEKYWSKIKFLFQIEGIPLQKRETTSLFSLPQIQEFLARVSYTLREIDSSETKSFLFQTDELKLLFSDFERKYSLLDEKEDLLKIPPLQSTEKQNERKKEYSFQEILTCLESAWQSEQLDPLNSIISKLDHQIEANQAYSASDWKNILYRTVAQIEVSLENENLGVVITSLNNADSLTATHRIFIGLTEEALKKSPVSIIPFEDVSQIHRDLGFLMEHPDRSPLEFELAWQMNYPSHQDIFSTPQSDFQGQIQGPPLFFIENCLQDGRLQLKKFSLADARLTSRSQKVSEAEGIPSEFPPSLVQRLKQDNSAEIKISTGNSTIEISATHLENYGKCPFIYFAQKKLKLQDLPELDFDIDPMSEGQLYHSLFEAILKKKNHSWNEIELEKLFDEKTLKMNFYIHDQELWNNYRKKVIQSLKNFIQFETAWVKEHTQSFISSLEEAFDFESLILDKPVRFSGRFDRIEKDSENKIFIVDYKRNSSKFKNPNSWIKENTVQLLFYAWVIQRLFSDQNVEVSGGAFYDYQKLKRDVGFFQQDLSKSFLPSKVRSIFLLKSEDFQKLLQDFDHHLSRLIQKMSEGDYSTHPLDPTTCKTCDWRKLCRAPHLR